jgi:uncharacterized protein YukE
MPPLLQHLNVLELVSAAGGDPWQLDESVQAGAPSEISELATAFADAGTVVGDTKEEFDAAQRRFEQAWDRDDGGSHPINDSTEVQQATTALHLDKEQLGRVATNLAEISASLAEAQNSCASAIEGLDSQLRNIDRAIDAAIAQNGDIFDDSSLAPLKNMAVQAMADALADIRDSRSVYAGALANGMDGMRAEGYLPDAIDSADGNGASATTLAQAEAGDYNFQQLPTDQALVSSGGPMTPEKEAAAARLRDYAVIQNPASDAVAVRLAGERLDDFQKAQQQYGSLPADPVLGTDPQRRAFVRQEWQKQLEKGSPWQPPMTPDEATAWLDAQESKARAQAIDVTIEGLESQGLSKGAATAVAGAMSQGLSLKDIAAAAGPMSEVKQVDGALSDGKHALPWERFSTAELKAVAHMGRGLAVAGPMLEFVAAWQDVQNGAPPGKTWGEAIGSVGGGTVGGMGIGFLGGMWFGPPGMFIGAITGGLAFGAGGSAVGGNVGSRYDN